MAQRAKASELRKRLAQLKAERQPLDPLYRKLKKFVLPDSGRFDAKTQEDDDTGYEFLADATATEALDTLGAGMLGGMTSPARQWFRLTTRSPKLDEATEVKEWLADVQREMLMVFAKSNVYQALNNAYLELATFGTACMIALPSSDHVIHLHTMTAGEYWLQEDSERRVNTMYRELHLTAVQCVEQFGIDKVSRRIREAYRDNAHCFDQFTIVHCVEPRPDIDDAKRDQLEMPWRSVYFEETADYTAESIEDGAGGVDKILLEEGFSTFPVLAPRWTLSPLSAYGRSPAMKALNTIRALQKETEWYEDAVALAVKPPLAVPTSFVSHPLDFGPGGISFVDITQNQTVSSLFEARLDIRAAREGILDKRDKINNFFFKDLFLMLEQTQRNGRTAYEVEKLEKERMMVLGPVLERLHAELLDPLITATLQCLARFGRLPPLPAELGGGSQPFSYGADTSMQGASETDINSIKNGLNIEYLGVLAQAQKAADVDAMSQYVQSIAGAAQVWPDVTDNLDSDAWAKVLADRLGIDPELVRTDEARDEIRDERARQMAIQQQMQQAQSGARTAKDLSAAMPEGQSLQEVVGNMTGY